MQHPSASSETSWDDYRLLLAVAEAGSLQSASTRLAVATSTVSRRLSAWERRLGTSIVHRHSAGVSLTEAGRELAATARELAAKVSAAEQALAGRSQAQLGSIRITVADGMGEVLVPVLAAFHARHPSMQLELMADSRIADLAKGEADLAIRALRPVGNTLLARKLGTFRLGLYASSDYLRRQGVPRRLQELTRHAFVGLTASAARNPTQHWLAELGVERTSFCVSSVPLLIRAVHAGIGIGAFAHGLAAGLTRVLPSLETPPHPVWLVRRKDTKGQRSLDLLAEHLAAHVRELAR
jgi:DNA-binding transcriptional LysR family regulator